MRDLSDEQLVMLVREGCNEAFSILVERYQKQIFALAYRLGGDYDEARDMAQESFLRVYQELSRYDTSRRFFPWLYRVAHNTCINMMHRRPKETSPLDSVIDLRVDEEDREANPGVSYEQQELSSSINQALQALPEKYRLPLVMKYLEGMSYQQISEQLDLPVSTIETRLFRGRKMLKNTLAKFLHKD
ncbi:MAG: sigma-70 family RNA polymerase sigma factor [Firmicutes bacterium]|nr:sigma-70 family RNA polymerase sigma factor [Bacillota bacterium]